MKAIQPRFILVFSIIVLAFFILLFRPFLFDNKILFPSNLLVSAYAPWKYEPVAEYPHGPPNKPMGFDDIRQFFPNRKLLAESFAKGVIPLWNPYIYSGTPFMAAFDTAVWYPLSWIAALMPVVAGWNFLVIIQPVLTLFFMFLFLRSMKFKPFIAAYGAFVFAFSGFMVVYWQEILVLEHSFLWLPLAMYASNRLWSDSRDRWGFVLLAVALASSVFGGFLQMSVYVYAIVIIWNIFCYFLNRKAARTSASIKTILYAIGLSILIACIQLIPSIEAFLSSPRGTANGAKTFSDGLLPFQNLITLIAPDFWGNPGTYTYFGGAGFYFEKMIFIGVIPLVFAIYAVGERKNKKILFWAVTAIIALSMGFALPTSWLPNILHIPVLSNSYPTRIFGIWVFAATILSCYGLSSIITKANYRRFIYIVGGLTVLLATGWVVVLSAWCVLHGYTRATPFFIIGHIPSIFNNRELYATVSFRNLIIPTIFITLGWGLIPIRKLSVKMTLAFVIIATMASGLYFAQKYIYFSERKFVYPDLPVISEISSVAGYDRVWGYGDAYIEKNIPQYYRWFSTDGYGNLSPNRYAELLSTIVNSGKLGGLIRRSDTDMYEVSERDSMNSNPFRLRMMSLLGVKYILEVNTGNPKDKRTSEERFPSALFIPVWQNGIWKLWQFKQAQPRVVYATNYLVKKTPQDIVDALYDPNIHLTDTVILEKDPGVKLTQKPFSGCAQIVSYDMNTVKIRTNSDLDGLVLLTDNYYPGWFATVDGKVENIYRADYAFKAVFVPSGAHTVVFYYLPLSVIIGGVVSIGGIIASVTLILFMRRKQVTS